MKEPGTRLPRCLVGMSRVRWRAHCAALLGAVGLVGCGDAPPEPDMGAGEARSLGRAEARAVSRAERRAPEARVLEMPPAPERPVRRAAAVRPRAPATATARLSPARTAPPRLDLALLAMEPAEVMRTLREGPLESAHYVLQRESQVEVEGERPQAVEGDLSLIDCSRVAPDDPSRGRALWIGGLPVEGAPELFEGPHRGIPEGKLTVRALSVL